MPSVVGPILVLALNWDSICRDNNKLPTQPYVRYLGGFEFRYNPNKDLY